MREYVAAAIATAAAITTTAVSAASAKVSAAAAAAAAASAIAAAAATAVAKAASALLHLSPPWQHKSLVQPHAHAQGLAKNRNGREWDWMVMDGNGIG